MQNVNIADVIFSLINQKQKNIKMGLVDFFYDSMKSWFVPNGLDCSRGDSLSDEQKATLRCNFGISLNEVILFKRDTSFWSNNDQGLVITDKGLYCIPDNEDSSSSFNLYWNKFNRVRYQELMLYFYNDDMEVAKLRISNFYKGDEHDFSKLGYKLEKSLTQVAQLVDTDASPLDLAEEGKFEEALKIADSNIESEPQNFYNHFAKARVIFLMECQKENPEDLDEELLELSLRELQKAADLMDNDDKGSFYLIGANFGYVNRMLGRDYQARNAFVMALDGCDDDDARDYIMQELEDSENCLKETWDNYTTAYEYKDRQFIMPIKDNEIGGCIADGIDVFRKSNIPSCFKFPTGHPIANQLYIGHPYNPSLYVPFEESEDIFFVDKVHELCYLLECLGAEEINISAIKGKSVSEFNQSQGSYSGSADVKLFSGEGNGMMQSRHQGESTSNNQRTMRIKLDPMQKPYLPDGLIWYGEQPQWQRLVNSRINGNMLEYNEFVSTSQTKFTSNQKKKDIKVSAKYLWTKVHAEVDQNIETQFKETTETQWKVEVKFRSIKDFNKNVLNSKEDVDSVQTQTPRLTKAEEEYIEDLSFCLENGEIGPKERRFLARKQEKLGISSERAKELEASLTQTQLTEEEKEYVEAVKEQIEDGCIPESSKRLLSRFRKSMGISDDRANELDSIAIGYSAKV